MQPMGQRFKRIFKDYCWEKDIKRASTLVKKQTIIDQLVIFDTAIASDNLGDYIIQYYCKKIIDEIFKDKKQLRVPTQTLPSEDEINSIAISMNKIVCGTNLITPHFEEFSNWKMPRNLYGYQNIITMGVGWGYYCKEISRYSKLVYNTILSKKYIHSVRDNYTYSKFKQMGIDNVINTGCPTLWDLTEEHCKSIPTKKASKVVTTITDYDRDSEADSLFLKVLLEQYDRVYVWIQGADDLEYLCDIIDINLVTILPRELDSFTRLLEAGDIDYVGTRLHAGIHALNKKVRSLIIAIDNRAIEMGRDYNLPIIPRCIKREELTELINSEQISNVHINKKNISMWKNQFIL